MFDFNHSFQFARPRSMALAPTGMVATSHPLAAQAALQMLHTGGNAVDAAVAAAAVLAVVEPMSTGLGGDAFALICSAGDRKITGLNASGRSPGALSLEALAQRGLTGIPEHSGLSVTVPGVVDGWAKCLERYGRLGWDQVLAPAIDYAEKGFLVTPIVASLWAKQVKKLSGNHESARVFLCRGKAPKTGTKFCNLDLGRSLRLLVENGPREFYQGALAAEIAEAVREAEGVLAPEDLQEHRSDWVAPLATRYRGHEVLELPPNTQGLAVLLALNLMAKQPLSSLQHNSGEYLHFLIECIKLSFADAGRYIADPEHEAFPIEKLLSPAYTDHRYGRIDSNQALEMPPGRLSDGSDTVYIAVVDGEGNAISLINSLYRFFGSGITVPGTGILLQNRGIGFNCDPDHPNCVAPRKRCFHTLVPAMIRRDEKLWAVLGVVGASMQPQGHVQVMVNLIDFHMTPQAALDAPRFRFLQELDVALEKGISARARRELADKGHIIYPGQFPDGFGGGQTILVSDEGLCGGSDFRKDGCAVGY